MAQSTALKRRQGEGQAVIKANFPTFGIIGKNFELAKNVELLKLILNDKKWNNEIAGYIGKEILLQSTMVQTLRMSFFLSNSWRLSIWDWVAILDNVKLGL